MSDPTLAAPDAPPPVADLIQKWRDMAAFEHEAMSNAQSAHAFDQCADELERALKAASPSPTGWAAYPHPPCPACGCSVWNWISFARRRCSECAKTEPLEVSGAASPSQEAGRTFDRVELDELGLIRNEIWNKSRTPNDVYEKKAYELAYRIDTLIRVTQRRLASFSQASEEAQ